MWDKSIPRLAFYFSLKVTFGIVIAMLMAVLISGAVGTLWEIIGRLIVGTLGSLLIFWLFFIFYLYINPDIWEKALVKGQEQ